MKAAPLTPRAYCGIALLTALVLLGAVAGFNLLVDPFAMVRLAGIDGFNSYKPAIYQRVRLFKAYEVNRRKPRTLILGTSRTHVGLRCSHPALARLPQPCYNLAFDGATAQEMYRYLRHAQAVAPLKQVLLGLDNYHATSAPSGTRPGFDPLLLFDQEDAALPSWAAGDLRLLVSFDTLAASIQTIRAQDRREPSWFAADGQRVGEVFFRRPGENFVRYGPRAYYDEIDRMEVGFQTAGAAPPDKRAPASEPPDPAQSSLAYIGRIVAFCREHGIELHVFITPSHVHQLEITHAAGGWTAIENGKRALVRLLAQDAARHPGAAPYGLIDFSGYSRITTEPLPAPGSHEEMRYYWDSSHFKSIVGDYLLDRMFDLDAPFAPPDFGVALTPATIEGVLAAQRSAHEAYCRDHPQEVGTLQAMVRAALGRNAQDKAATRSASL